MKIKVLLSGLVLAVLLVVCLHPVSGNIVQSFYSLVQDEGVSLTRRQTLNCVGAGIACTDAGGKTVLTVGNAAGSCGSATTEQVLVGSSCVGDDNFSWRTARQALSIGGGGNKNMALGIVPKANGTLTGTTTANNTTAIVGMGTLFLSEVEIGDLVSLSSAPTAFAVVSSIASNTSMTVGVAVGNGTSQTFTIRHGYMVTYLPGGFSPAFVLSRSNTDQTRMWLTGSPTEVNYAMLGDSNSLRLNHPTEIDLCINDCAQQIVYTSASFLSGVRFSGPAYSTLTNCADSAGAAACGSAAAGSFVTDAAATSTVVSTTAVTANSQIFVFFDASLGTRLGITCNTTVPALYGVTARTAGTSFTLTTTAPVTNPACFNYFLVN